MAEKGLEEAVRLDPGLAKGLNIYRGKITNFNVAKALNMEFSDPLDAIGK